MPKIVTIAHLDSGLEQKWLQHLRNFDIANPGCHFQVAVNAPDATLDEVVQMLKVDPELKAFNIKRHR